MLLFVLVFFVYVWGCLTVFLLSRAKSTAARSREAHHRTALVLFERVAQ